MKILKNNINFTGNLFEKSGLIRKRENFYSDKDIVEGINYRQHAMPEYMYKKYFPLISWKLVKSVTRKARQKQVPFDTIEIGNSIRLGDKETYTGYIGTNFSIELNIKMHWATKIKIALTI